MASSQLPQKSDAKNLLSASAEGVKFLVLLQVSSRFLTFLVNQLLLRYLSPALLGISVQLELFTVTILYFSRESIRNALQRHVSVLNDSQKISLTLATKGLRPGEGIVAADTQSIVNISILTVPLGVLFSVFFGYIYAGGLASTESTQQPYFGLSIGLYILATLLELISEPGFAISQHRMLYKLRTGAESAAALVRCILTCGITVWAARGGLIMGPLPFAIGQIGYGAVLMTVYGVKTWRLAVNEGFKMGLITIEEGKGESRYYWGYFNKKISSLAVTMWIQSSIKHVLTQADSIMVAWLTSVHDQGVYAFAANYGSLIARILFQPLEESSRNLFSKLLSKSTKDENVETSALLTAARILKVMIKLYLLLSIFATVLGPPFAAVGLKLIAGSRWSNSAAGEVLATYCYYIPLLAINGITESLVQSVATPKDLHKQSAYMFSFSLGFAIASYTFVRTLGWGAQGLVWANVINMALRIIWSSVFIQNYFSKHSLKPGWMDVIPSGTFVAISIGTGAILRGHGVQSQMPSIQNLGLIYQLGTAAMSAGFLFIICAILEKKFLHECWDMIRTGR